MHVFHYFFRQLFSFDNGVGENRLLVHSKIGDYNNRAACKTPCSLNLYVMLKFLSSAYQLYACGKNFSHALTLNENHHFAKDSVVYLISDEPALYLLFLE